jgi:membrane protein DedA with SNARE-associated domain
MLTLARLSTFAIAAGAVVSSGSLSGLNFVEALSDSFWTYALLGLSSIVIEELAPVFGGIAAHEGELQLFRVIVGITLGGWLCTALLYVAGRFYWDALRRRFPRLRAGGTVALRVVGRNPLTASFLVRFAFGLRIVLPIACGAARVPWLTYFLASLFGSLMWTTLYTLIGYAAGEAAVRAVGHLGRVGELIGAAMVTAAVFAFVWWNRRRRARKDERKRQRAEQRASGTTLQND